MTGHKELEQSLKRPDTFQDSLLKALDFLTKNKSKVAMYLTPVLVVGALGYGFYSWRNHKAAARRAELAKISSIETDELMSVGKRRDEIQKQIDALRASKSGSDPKKSDLAPETLAKITLLESQMSDVKPDSQKSSAAYKAFYENNKDNTEGWMAGLSFAAKLLQDDKAADARPVVEAIAKASGSHKFYQLTARFMLIGILEDAGDFDTAVKECDALTAIASDDAKPAVLLAKGRILYFKKSFADARVSLNELVEKHGSSPEASKARGLLAAMGPA
jgi:predicted negative regulator of RcsB-dependent stress response